MALNVCCRLMRRVCRAPRYPCLQYQQVSGEVRSFSSRPSVVITYEPLRKLLVSGSGVLIDVREPWELREYGSIPGSINVPLGQLSGALRLNPGEFKERYGGDMPSLTESIVFTCLAGVRSQKALEAAVTLGYSNAQHYPGGWKDWAEHEILQTKE